MVAAEGIGCSSPALERLEACPAEASELGNRAVNTHTQSPATPLPPCKSHILALESVKTLGEFRTLTWRTKGGGGRYQKVLVQTQLGRELGPSRHILTRGRQTHLSSALG